MNVLKSILHNIGVLIVGLGFGELGTRVDALLHFTGYRSVASIAAGALLLAIGFFIRVWATLLFYQRDMNVIVLRPQAHLVTTGPFRFSRNPLYLGGNLFIFLGAVIALGSLAGLGLTALNLVAVDVMARREEKQLEQRFGDEWRRYAARTHRWLG